MKKRNLGILLIFIAFVIMILVYGLTFIPQNVISINAANVSQITIFNGNTGEKIEIWEKDQIEYIVNDLNEVVFKKDKLDFGYMGYSFKAIIYDKEGKPIENLIINSEKVIRYKGFFYEAENNLVDYSFIVGLFE